MVDNATLKNPNSLLPKPETTTELSGEKRTWTPQDEPEAGTQTLQAIVDARDKEKNDSLAKEQGEFSDPDRSTGIKNKNELQSDRPDTNEIESEGAVDNSEENEEEEDTRMALNQKQMAFAAKNTAQKKHNTLNFGWFILALILALLFDGAGALINLIPYVGQGITTLIITPIGLLSIWLIDIYNGVPFDGRAKKRLLATGIVEFIPVIQVIPALTACVLLAKFIPMLDIKSTPFVPSAALKTLTVEANQLKKIASVASIESK